MKTKLNAILIFGLAAVGLSLLAFTIPQDDWVVPEKYNTMKNPYAGEDEDGIGEELFAQHCKSCHGKEGYGDGTKAKELDTEMRELGSAEVQSQSDGALFFKGVIGRDEMPNFEKKIRDEEDRWMVINYLRTLKE